MVDEAHRTQYKSLAENMRHGLPKAQYMAFTGTPLLGRERKTNAWFGDYVSEYNFQQSMDDGATVPLFYQKRVPQVLIQNEDLSDEFYEILEDENLDDAQKEKLENKFSTEVEVIRRDDRLEAIAKDIVYHFPRRGYLGKGIVISLDKFTAVKMYDKVQRLWKEQIKELLGRIKKSGSEIEKERLKKRVDYMRRVEMAVVVSEEAGEEEKFKKQDLDIKPHRQRMNSVDEHGHDIEFNFKDPEHPLQLVFVCAMWLTGFDAPTVSTLYLDKPQKDHTLMQSIARANRVTSFKINGVEKRTGEIVDYYNVFRNMKKALKDYAQGAEGADEPPVKEKAELFRLLDDSIEQATAFCQSHSVRIDKLLKTEDTFKNVEKFKKYADILLTQDEWRKAFSVYENTVTALYEASKPEILRQPEIVRTVAVFQYLRGVIDAIIEQTDIDAVGLRVGELLDESVVVAKESNDAATDYGILKQGRKWDLSKIDFEELRKDFKKAAYRNIEIADLRAFIEKKLEQMLKENRTRSDFAQRLQEIIDEYNAGGTSNENYFEELLKFTKELKAEAERHVREGLSEDELELFDLIKKDAMTKDETQRLKLAAKATLNRLPDKAPQVLIHD
jgi:type I restriction enzyme R subunit